MLGGCQPALKQSYRAGTQLGPDLLGQRVRPLTPPHAREAEKTQRLLSRSCLFSLHPALHTAPSPDGSGGKAGAPSVPRDWRDSLRGDARQRCQPPRRLSFPGSQTADGKRVARGCPQAWGPARLPTRNFILLHLSSRQGSPGLCPARWCPGACIPRGLGARSLLPSPPAAGLPLSPELTDRAGPQLRFLRHTKNDFKKIFFPFKGKKK